MPRTPETDAAGYAAPAGGSPAENHAERLSKRVAALFSCSRSQAEHYIEGGWIRVDGEVVETPQFRVSTQEVTLAADASQTPLPPVTLLYHQAADQALDLSRAEETPLSPASRWTEDRAPVRMLKRHFSRLVLPCPLDKGASGLVLLTQDGRLAHRLLNDAAQFEQEIIVEIKADPIRLAAQPDQPALSASDLKRLNHGLMFRGKPLPPIKVSWQSEHKLRFALKNPLPGQIADMCAQVGLSVVTMKRIRIGRLSMAGLPVGQWRYLAGYERL